jgi:hypothetical protein
VENRRGNLRGKIPGEPQATLVVTTVFRTRRPLILGERPYILLAKPFDEEHNTFLAFLETLALVPGQRHGISLAMPSEQMLFLLHQMSGFSGAFRGRWRILPL